MHEHTHSHHHSVNDANELLALIKYMANHNASHTSELENLSKKVENADAVDVLNQAIAQYSSANELLNKAIDLIEGGK